MQPGSTHRAHTTCLPSIYIEFYREELLKHHRCLREQRYSEQAMCCLEAAITRLEGRLEDLCRRGEAGHVVSCILRQFDHVTRLSTLHPPSNLH